MHRLQYGIISYGSTPKIELSLEDSLKPDVKQRVEAIDLPSGTPDLATSLQLGEKLLIPGRPNAEKVLVVITDTKSGSSAWKIKLAAEYLDDKDIRVFSVAIGSEADPAELAIASGSKKNVINSSNTDEPEKIREDIMDKIRQGKQNYAICKVRRSFCSPSCYSLSVFCPCQAEYFVKLNRGCNKSYNKI